VRYSEILGLYENFKPAYDLTDEIKNGWKQFIPVDSFIDLLSSFLEALESSDPRTKRSIGFKVSMVLERVTLQAL